jgi:hypothetical protein
MASNNLADSYVYVLFRADGTPFYVGAGRKSRWADHEKHARWGIRPDLDRLNIIREMIQAGFKGIPKVKIAEGLTHQEARLREIALIAAIGRHPDGPLTNQTPGGDGYRDQPAELRAKTIARNRARIWTPEMRAKAAASLRGKKLSPETIAKMVATRKERGWSEERRAKIAAETSARLLGKPKSPEHVAKMAAAKRGKPLPPLSAEHKAAIGNAHRGKVYSPETRAKISAARKEYYAKRRAFLNEFVSVS